MHLKCTLSRKSMSMKTPYPWYSESRSGGGWFVKLGGEQQFLGKHPPGAAKPENRYGKWNPPAEILQAFYQLMAVRNTASKADYPLETICALYLEELGEDRPELVKRYKPTLGSFCDHNYKGRRVGKLLVNAELEGHHLEMWAKQFPSEQTQRTYINCVRAALKWAVNKKAINITKNPLAAAKCPGVQSRAVITPEEHLALLNHWDDSFRDFLQALWFTGARPGEIAKIETRHLQDGLWRLDPTEHKTGRVTGRDRVIGIVGELAEIVERLSTQYPEGHIFRNTYGRPWTTGASFVRFDGARNKKIIRPEVTPYAYRHAWATHALEKGNLDAYEVAKALGHQTTQMVMLHYDHSRKNVEHLREIFQRSGRGIILPAPAKSGEQALPV